MESRNPELTSEQTLENSQTIKICDRIGEKSFMFVVKALAIPLMAKIKFDENYSEAAQATQTTQTPDN